MIYTWRCQTCDQVVEVQRKVADYQLPPTDAEIAGQSTACSGMCSSTSFSRVITRPLRIFCHEDESVYERYNG